MGRTFYAAPKIPQPDWIIHILTTEFGSVVVAVRPPEIGERGYSVGYDQTLLQAAHALLDDWQPDEDEPGWCMSAEEAARPRRGDGLYEITILGAFEGRAEPRTRITVTGEPVITGLANGDRVHRVGAGGFTACDRTGLQSDVESVITCPECKAIEPTSAVAIVDFQDGRVCYRVTEGDDHDRLVWARRDDEDRVRRGERVSITFRDGEDGELVEVLS